MKNQSIEIAIEFDEEGLPTEYETFVTRPNKITFMLVYECVSFLASLEGEPSTSDMHQMVDLVIRIYDNQMSKSVLVDGLTSYSATLILYEQIVNIASGNSRDSKSKVSKEVKDTEVTSWEEAKDSMKKVYKDMAKAEGSDVNSILSLPFFFVFDELNSQSNTVKRESSMLSAFG